MPFTEQPLTIWKAANQGLLTEVQQFVADGIPVDAKDRGNVTPLHKAADAGHVELAEWLLDNGASINERTTAERGYPGAETPLYMAVEAGKLRVAEMLLRRGANPNLKSSDGSSALEMAAQSGNRDLVDLLVGHGADVNPKGESNPLLSALYARNLEMAQYLIQHGARTDVKVWPFGGSLLISISSCKWLPGVEFLLSLGADVNQVDDQGSTALHSAILSYGSRKIESIKTEWGEKVVVTERPEDALPVVRKLLEAGANLTLRDKSGLTPLDYATKMRAQVLIDLLLKSGGRV